MSSEPKYAEPFIVDNAAPDYKVADLVRRWSRAAVELDVATGHFEIGGILALRDDWTGVKRFRVLLGDQVTARTKRDFDRILSRITRELDGSIEDEKRRNDFLDGINAIVEAMRAGRFQARVYRKAKFHAKAYIARGDTGDATALVGSSNFTLLGLTQNVELNVRHTGPQAAEIATWFDRHWEEAEDITADLLRVIDRHIEPFTPFQIYAKSLQELFLGHSLTETEWETGAGPRRSRVYPLLDRYQRDGYHHLVKIAERFGGAFLCDGVGLGKTFMGLMLIERLVVHERKNVCLLVPKAARKPVWEAAIKRYLPDLGGVFGSRLTIYNHTDLIRGASADRDFPAEFRQIAAEADTFVIDEAHHFRNPGIAGEGERKPSRYRKLFDICDNKQMFLLTATPVNNRLIDLQHMIELFSRKIPDYFQHRDPTLGVHSLPGHFRKMEKDLEQLVYASAGGPAPTGETPATDLVEAERVLSDDRLFRRIVVQRSRSYVKESQIAQGGRQAIFPVREAPRVADYHLRKTYGRLLGMVETAFKKEKPLFSLAIYNPMGYPAQPGKEIVVGDELFPGATKGRQMQIVGLIRTSFLKRFESSAEAFRRSCRLLLLKLLAFAEVHTETREERQHLDRFKSRHAELVGRVERDPTLFDDPDADESEDLVPVEMIEEAEAKKLRRSEYNVAKMLDETRDDLETVADFLKELDRFEPANDDKLKALIRLLKTDSVLKHHKVLIFTEFTDTARYLEAQLAAAGITGVAEIDGSTRADRGDVIRQFSPYYNGSSSGELAASGMPETRVLISTDVLSEGLNLQDATRLINYDLHWNPVRLMQRIGRVDRRMNPEIESLLLADDPDQSSIRGNVVYWNFLPPDELNELLTLYSRVTHKTLRISKTFGIEGRKLLTPDDDYEALKDFNKEYEGTPTDEEKLHLEYLKLVAEHPGLEEKLEAMPHRAFSGRSHPRPNSRAVFFCYALPGPPSADAAQPTLFTPGGEPLQWVEETGETRWYLYDLATGNIKECAADIADVSARWMARR
ncbi:helicase-related protein [Humisphaera borealis]|uniref:DEAD/DEAH box helicase family protein n=1 Tax=Humisphaera borealis TaxID=2807512 RepID=A0A7M2WZB9_9BACT|nr:helicase-related protein [Humisphaera borealis]QOV90201.1 DEAD/DEAH box helicase family protein [Humisphaera borealis]